MKIIATLLILFYLLVGCAHYGCIEGNCTNGLGTHTYANGEKYVGEYKDDKRNGQGTYTWPNGNKYVGEFKDGKKHGQGTLTSPDGKVERGIWKNNKIEKLVEQDSNQTSVKTSSTTPCPACEIGDWCVYNP